MSAITYELHIYKNGTQNVVGVIHENRFWIPEDESFKEYQEYLQWIQLGNSPKVIESNV